MSRRTLTILAITATALIAIAISGEVQSRNIERNYEDLAEVHLSAAAGSVRDRVLAIEASLQREIESVVSDLKNRALPPSAPQLFHLLESATSAPDRGFRITDDQARLVAWWGVALPRCPDGPFCFDVTDLYVVSREEVVFGSQGLVIEHYARIPNGEQPAISRFSLAGVENRWVASGRFHTGTIQAVAPTRQFEIASRQASRLFLNLTPRPETRVAAGARNVTRSIVSLATALLLIASFFGFPGGSGRDRRPWGDILVIIAARVILLAIQPIEDPTSIFGYYTYASRLLGPFARSPFDLLLTSIAILSIVVVSRKGLGDRPLEWARAIALPASLVALVSFLSNLIQNSRATSIPDHISPESAAQAFLFSSILLLGATMTEIAFRRERASLSIGPTLVMFALIASGSTLLPSGVARDAFLFAAIPAVLISVLSGWIRGPIPRLGVRALLVSILIYPAAAMIEDRQSRDFVEKTWAPLVATQADQLVSLVESSLDRQFSGIDLTLVLPDTLERTDLTNLAWVLWSRSSLSDWRIPSSVIAFDLEGHTISRFGVGLPEIREHTTHAQETIRVGSLVRELVHRDFALLENGDTVAELTVHIVDPSDAGATTFSDLYRDLFAPQDDPWADPFRSSSMPALYDENGVSVGATRVRLPRNPGMYLEELGDGEGRWAKTGPGSASSFVMRVGRSLYAFPLTGASWADHFRRWGTTTLWAAVLVLLVALVRERQTLARFVSGSSGRLGFHARTSL